MLQVYCYFSHKTRPTRTVTLGQHASNESF